jgi:hypothetical protein
VSARAALRWAEFVSLLSNLGADSNVPNQSAGHYWGGPVRLDAVGNIFVSSGVRNPSTGVVNFFIYGFAPAATGNAAPTVRIPGATETANSRFAIN